MKKILFSIILIGGLCLTGCSKTELLECSTSTTTEDGSVISQNVVVTFNGVKATRMDMDMTYTLSDTLLPNIDLLKDTLNDEFENQGIDVTTTTEDNKIKMNLVYDIENMTAEEREKLELEDIYGTVDATKEAFEKNGYTCK